MKNSFSRIIIILFTAVFILSFGHLKAQTFRILPLGNSITAGMLDAANPAEFERISYRKELFDQLSGGGYSFDFVGHGNAGYNLFSDADHGGIPGTRAQYLVRLLEDGYDERWAKQITPGGEPYLDVYPTDIILLHIGTNDIIHDEGSGVADMVNILDRIDAWEESSGNHVAVFIARIIKRGDNPSANTTTTQLNDNVASMVAERGDPSVFMVNLETGAGIDYNTEMMPDGVHPSQSAYDKMGRKWYSSLDAYFSAIPDPPDGFSLSGKSATSIELSWNDNSNNECGFEIGRSSTSEGGSFTLIHTTGAGTTSFTDGGLNENTLYYYRVRAYNAMGPSFYTSNESAYTSSASLAAPTGLLANPVNEGTINLIWSDNSDSETAYLIERSESSGSGFTLIHTAPVNETFYADNGLSDGVEYFYRVRATNGVANSSYSNEASAVTDLFSPTELSASAVDEGTINLAWTDRSVSESAYIIERSKSSGSGFTEIHTASANETFYADKGLSDGVEYFYRVRAIKGVYNSAYSNVSNASTDLAAPTGLSAISVDGGTSLAWTDNSVSETAYIIERSENPGTGYAEIGVSTANSTSYTDNGSEEGFQFFYRVRATNGVVHSAYSNETSATTILASPTGLLAISMDEAAIRLIWSDNSTGETAYIIERSESSGSGFTQIHATSANEALYTDNGLADGMEYFYRVRATNGIVNSVYSNEVSATTDLINPTGMSASAVDEATINLAWSDNSVSESAYLIERSESSGSGYTEIHTASVNETFYTNNGLSDGIEYFYRVRAIKGENSSTYSNEASATTDLATPTGLSAVLMEEGTIYLAWSDNSVSESGYVIERSENPGTEYSEIAVTSANAISLIDKEFADGDHFYYRIRATNGMAYSAYSNEARSARNVILSDSLFSFYPNPNSGNITMIIRKGDEDVTSADIRIIDFTGRVYYYEEIDLSDGMQVKVHEVQLPPSLANGFYSLTLFMGTKSISERFVLIR